MPEPIAPSEPTRRFAGCTALVTGGGSDIGLAIAKRLLAEGGRVLLTDVATNRIDEHLIALGGDETNCLVIAADLSKPAERDRLVEQLVARWDAIDILVNNAALQGERVGALDVTTEAIERIFAVNFSATFALCRQAGRQMAERGGGAIVNITSIQTHMPVSTYAAYVSSKGAIAALTRALAVELSERGVRVNAVAPGVIATEAFTRALGTQSAAATAVPTLLGRHGRAEEVAAAIAFLASSDASFITGVELTVDGGRSLSRRPDAFEQAFSTIRESGSI